MTDEIKEISRKVLPVGSPKKILGTRFQALKYPAIQHLEVIETGEEEKVRE